MKTILALGLAALIAAPVLAAGPNNFSEQLKKLPAIQQKAVIRRAILDDSQICKSVDASSYQGSFKNLEMWTGALQKG